MPLLNSDLVVPAPPLEGRLFLRAIISSGNFFTRVAMAIEKIDRHA
jgi:hypothetical protein